MAEKATTKLPTEILALGGTAALTGLLIWMVVLIVAPIMLLAMAGAWIVCMIIYHRHSAGGLSHFLEYFIQTAMIGAQITLLVAIIMLVAPNLV